MNARRPPDGQHDATEQPQVWRTVPHTNTDEMMHAVAVTRSDQACNISRTHRPLRFVTQGRQKWRKPYFQIWSPVGVHRQIPLQLVFHESPIASVGNPYSKFSAKVVLNPTRYFSERKDMKTKNNHSKFVVLHARFFSNHKIIFFEFIPYKKAEFQLFLLS